MMLNAAFAKCHARPGMLDRAIRLVLSGLLVTFLLGTLAAGVCRGASWDSEDSAAAPVDRPVIMPEPDWEAPFQRDERSLPAPAPPSRAMPETTLPMDTEPEATGLLPETESMKPDELITDQDLMVPPAEDGYAIQPGDQLGISVWREEDLDGGGTVRPDGTISFPLLGQVHVAGKTVPQVTKDVTTRLSKYLPDPVVTVTLGQLTGNQIYVIGKVARPGAFALNRYVDVMQALSMAGGMTPFARTGKIKILRRTDGERQIFHFDYGDVEKGKNLEQNITLQSGDVVIVP